MGGCGRAGELMVPSASAFDPAVHLAWGDVAADENQPPSMVQVFLKRSKCDQFGRGVTVYVGKTDNSLCPLSTILAYVARHGNAPGAFFRFSSDAPLTKTRFFTQVREALLRASICYQNYSGYSFWIGAATAAAQAGIQDSTIQALGRWNSAAFLQYIRTQRSQLAGLSSAIAGRRD